LIAKIILRCTVSKTSKYVFSLLHFCTVVQAPDDGCQHPKYVQLSTEVQ